MQLLQTMPAGGVGAATFLGLTDTPASYSGEAAKYARVNGGESSLEFHDLLNVANAWAALQTFNAGIKLAAAQQIKDSGGTGRILLATALPHMTITGDAQFNASVGIESAPQGAQKSLNVSPTKENMTHYVGVRINPTISVTGNSRAVYGLSGFGLITVADNSTGHYVRGLDFLAVASALANATTRNVTGVRSRVGIYNWGAGGTIHTATEMTAFKTDHSNLQAMFANVTVTEMIGLYVQGLARSTASIIVGTVNAIKVRDFTGTSFSTVNLLELGPATPYFRVVGHTAPAADKSNVWINITNVGLRQIEVGGVNTGGAGYRYLRCLN